MRLHHIAFVCAGISILSAAFPVSASADTFIPGGDSSICYMGRWEVKPKAATTINSGSALRFRFKGRSLKADFDIARMAAPSQIFVSIDSGSPALFTVGKDEVDLAPGGLAAGDHVVELVVKDVDQIVDRWNPPFKSAIIFRGFDLGTDGAALDPAPLRVGRWSRGALRMLFIGDSITEGIRVLGMSARPDGSDGTKTYSYLTGLAFGANITQVGFGAQGLTRGGSGNVPKVQDSFALNFAGSPADARPEPDVIVVNQGTNDGGAAPSVFEPAYLSFLRQVRAACPGALIFAMRPFNGTHAASIRAAVAGMHDPRVIFVDTVGWIDVRNQSQYTEKPIGLHPSLAGHAEAARRLTAALRADGVGESTASRSPQ